MAGVGGPGYPAAPVPVLPSLSDDGQASHVSGAGVPIGRCGKRVLVLCLYRELLMQKCLGLASYLQVVKQRKLKNFQGTKAAFGARLRSA